MTDFSDIPPVDPRVNEPQEDAVGVDGEDILSFSYPEVDPFVTPSEEVASFATHPFQVVQAGETGLKVRYGTVNSVAPPQVSSDIDLASIFGGSPTALWISINLDSEQSVTSVSIQTSEPGTESATSAKIQLATISWSGGVANIGQNISGSLRLFSCGVSHFLSSI